MLGLLEVLFHIMLEKTRKVHFVLQIIFIVFKDGDEILCIMFCVGKRKSMMKVSFNGTRGK